MGDRPATRACIKGFIACSFGTKLHGYLYHYFVVLQTVHILVEVLIVSFTVKHSCLASQFETFLVFYQLQFNPVK